MNLLLANDDGYEAEGLRILAERLALEHNVYIVAPAGNRSAVSNHITMFNPTVIREISKNVWACEGYPSDCACIGIESNLFDVKFDAVVSGINCGANLGTDIIYSGTCAAARQAILNHVPAIALSVDPIDWEKASKEGFKYKALADFAAKNLETLISLCRLENPRAFVNVNGASIDEYKGAKLSKELCIRKYDDRLEIVHENDITKSEFKSSGSSAPDCSAESDFAIVRDGYVSVSIVNTDPVCQTVEGVSFKL